MLNILLSSAALPPIPYIYICPGRLGQRLMELFRVQSYGNLFTHKEKGTIIKTQNPVSQQLTGIEGILAGDKKGTTKVLERDIQEIEGCC